MIWSISKSKMFFQCPRKWFYSEIYSNIKSKDPSRRECGILKNLKNIYAWRGSIVDIVIHDFIIPKMKNNCLISFSEINNFTLELMNKQLDFAHSKTYREKNITKTNSGNTYCALYEIEYNKKLDFNQIEEAKNEAVTSLENLINSNFLQELISDSIYIISQRPLTFKLFDVSIRCVPDLIVFYSEKPPLIVDWKVHSKGLRDAWLQLGIYGIALSKVKPHIDFPENTKQSNINPLEIDFIEYQLLKSLKKTYSISMEDVINIEDYIFQSIIDISRLTNNNNFKNLNAEQFPTTNYPYNCKNCQYRKICWVEQNFQISFLGD